MKRSSSPCSASTSAIGSAIHETATSKISGLICSAFHVGGQEEPELQVVRRVGDRIDVVHAVVHAAVQRGDQIDDERIDDTPSMSGAELGEVVVEVEVDRAERAQ